MKRAILSAAGLVFAASAATAQQAPQPSAPGTVVVSAIRAFATQYGTWLMTAFDSIPASKYNYKPTPAQMSVGMVAAHLEEANFGICSRFAGMPHPMTARDSTADSIKAMWPKDTLVARLKASFAFCNAAFDKTTDAMLTDSIPGFNPARKVVKARYVVVFVTDLVDHYSQLANYMRLNGMIPPSSYPRKP